MCNVHYGKAASGGIDNEITRLRDGSDQPCDQTGWFRVRVNSAINLLSPPVRNTAITPSRPRTQRRLLQHRQVIAAPPGAVAHADAPAIPADHIDAWKDVGDVEMSTRADAVRVGPVHQVTARPQHPRYIPAARVDIAVTHRRQCTARTLTGPLVAVFQPISTPRCCGSKNAAAAQSSGSDRKSVSASPRVATSRGHDNTEVP